MLRTLPVLTDQHLVAFANAFRSKVGPTLARAIPECPLKMHPVQKSEHVKTLMLFALESLILPDGPVMCDDNGVEGNRATTSVHVPTILGTEAIMINVGSFTDSRSFRMRRGTVTRQSDMGQTTIMDEGVTLDEDSEAIERFMIAIGLKRRNDAEKVVMATTADVRLIGGKYAKKDRLFRFTTEISLHVARYGQDEDGFDPGEPRGVTPPGRRK